MAVDGSGNLFITDGGGLLEHAAVAPAITSSNQASFTEGQAGSFTIATTSDPVASLSDGSATLPTGVSFVDHGDGTATLSGTPAAGMAGSYPITITAANGTAPDDTQSFTLTIPRVAPAITSPNHASFTEGRSGSFTIATTGDPVASLSDGSATLPAGPDRACSRPRGLR